jgi:iron complex transport system substrate-binding protein
MEKKSMNSCLFFMFVLLATCFNACQTKEAAKNTDTPLQTLSLRYAKGFEVKYFVGYTIISIKQAWKGSNHAIDYILVQDSTAVPNNLFNTAVILPYELNRIAGISTTYISFLELLEVDNRIKAISDIKYVCSPKMNAAFNKGAVKEIGFDVNLNMEELINLQCDALFTYAIDNSAGAMIQKMKDKKQKTVFVSEYLEETPLAQAEWIKFFGVIFHKEAKADSIFNVIEKKYLALQASVMKLPKPTVISNLPYKGNWHVPGGNSVGATFIKDAGAKYVFDNIPESGGVPLSFEAVYAASAHADFFIHVNSNKSLADVKKEFPEIINYQSFQKKNIFNNNHRININNIGNDYWESGISRPDIVLQDLIRIFHPELSKDNTLYYYTKLE